MRKYLRAAPMLLLLGLGLVACRREQPDRTVERRTQSDEANPKPHRTEPPPIAGGRRAQARALSPWEAYRTGRIERRVLEVPEKIQQGIFRKPEKYVEPLVSFLVAGARDDFHRAKLLHDWVAQNIEYDVQGYFSGDYKSRGTGFSDTLRNGSSVCDGYAGLFEHMCGLAGLECVKVSGYGRGYGHRLFRPEDPTKSNHAWNAVKIAGNWHLMDITWDAGHIADSREYTRRYRTDYLFLEPEKFLHTHLPTEEKWQLLAPPVSVDEFRDLPYLRGEFFGCGLDLAEPVAALTQVGDSATVDLLVPEGVQLLAQVTTAEDEEVENLTFIETATGAARVQALFPRAGQWKLRLFAGANGSGREERNEKETGHPSRGREGSAGNEPAHYDWVGDLAYEAAEGTDRRFPTTTTQFASLGSRLLEPRFGPLPQSRPLRFALDVPGVSGVAVFQDGDWTKLEQQEGTLWSGTATLRSSGSVKVVVQLEPEDRQWESILLFD